ncbi:MAG: hypothetical protein A3D65_01690 [Candidatus Lloydbacteria bacterium RIFCSPHIGHO2_02_FULL_50_13]|uniref:Uncharacterized protein n=1 Tax=Candidatus Lloydbacteria bacterium RIFCSPHIGHO2_02_FULL_50_13 TaxID=1798661 RepID=A0A1G2DB93_9BACT|nr:MAG: hypothetical protein A3D65_01690 [Candidatus Lloydbacteria bacterium RIFCSPHIGHO2_02_FULL_50_13]
MGFTLIETLLYIGLYSIIMGGAIVAVYTIFESAGRNQTKAMLQVEGVFLTGKINSALSGAKTIDTPSFGATSSQLSITKYDGTLISITFATGTMMILHGGDVLSLNNTNTEVAELLFTNIGTSSVGIIPEGVRAAFTLSARAPNGMIISQDFRTTRYLRK